MNPEDDFFMTFPILHLISSDAHAINIRVCQDIFLKMYIKQYLSSVMNKLPAVCKRDGYIMASCHHKLYEQMFNSMYN